jgi:IclR family mhp operon transcriptional activator
MGSYEPLKTVERTMQVLEELNRHVSRRVVELNEATGIPAPTLVRILETLEAMGYVRKLSRMGGYCVTQGVIALSGGYHSLPRMFDSLKAAADAFTRDNLWPVAISTPDGTAMIVRYSTIPKSPLSHKHSTLNRRLSMLSRAHGRAYLAHCPLEARQRIYELVIECGDYSGTIEQLQDEMAPILESIRANGIARRAADLEPDTKTIAVPVWMGKQVIAAIGVTYFRRSLADPMMLESKLRGLGQALRTSSDSET